MDASKPSIGVVVPLFNKEAHIKRCIRSILNQTQKPDLIVIVNDGSTDHGAHVAQQELSGYTGDSRLVSQANLGVSAARNKGVSICNTTYILFLDADDEWHPTHIETLSQLIFEFPDAALYSTGHQIYDPELGIISPKLGLTHDFRGYLDDFYAASCRGSIANSSKVAVSKHLLLKVGGFPQGATIGEDLYVWMRLAELGKVAFDSKATVTINQTFDVTRAQRKGAIPHALAYYSNPILFGALSSNARRYLSRILLFHIIDSSIRRDYAGGFKRIALGLRLFPARTMLYTPLLFVPHRLLLYIRKIRRLARVSRME